METATTTTAVIPKPAIVTPIAIDIVHGSEYPEDLWQQVAASIDAAEAEVIKARLVKRAADAAYEAAMAQREEAQRPRDQMIITDGRTPAQVGRLAGIGRARCSQIRLRAAKATATATQADAKNAA
jgi:hypothetical protein